MNEVDDAFMMSKMTDTKPIPTSTSKKRSTYKYLQVHLLPFVDCKKKDVTAHSKIVDLKVEAGHFNQIPTCTSLVLKNQHS